MARRRRPSAIVIGTLVGASCATAWLASHHRAQPLASKPQPAPRVHPPRAEQSFSPEEQRARHLASLDISAQTPEVQQRYAAAMAEATKQVIATRREALAALRSSRERLAVEHADAPKLQALDDQIRLSEEQLARAESAASGSPAKHE